MKWYFDSSVLIEVVLDPTEVKFPKKFSDDKSYTSRLSQVEVLRTITKVDPTLIPRALDILSQLNFIELDDGIITKACRYPQEITLKSSDAIHMASAQAVLDFSDELVTYDKQMTLNAKRLGVQVLGTI